MQEPTLNAARLKNVFVPAQQWSLLNPVNSSRAAHSPTLRNSPKSSFPTSRSLPSVPSTTSSSQDPLRSLVAAVVSTCARMRRITPSTPQASLRDSAGGFFAPAYAMSECVRQASCVVVLTSPLSSRPSWFASSCSVCVVSASVSLVVTSLSF